MLTYYIIGSERTPYTNNERLLLASLVDKHQDIIENKKTDASTIQEKNMNGKKLLQNIMPKLQ